MVSKAVFFLGYSPNYNLKGYGWVSNGGGGFTLTEMTIEFASAMEFGVDFWDTSHNSWGMISGVSTIPDRESKRVKMIGQTVSATGLKMGSTFLYLGAHYRWESFYIPFGLTYSFNRIKSSSTSAESLQVKNGVGAIIGLGWFLNDHLALGLTGKSSAVQLEATENGQTSMDTAIFSSIA